MKIQNALLTVLSAPSCKRTPTTPASPTSAALMMKIDDDDWKEKWKSNAKEMEHQLPSRISHRTRCANALTPANVLGMLIITY